MIYLTRIDDRSEGAFVFEGNENGDVLYTAIELLYWVMISRSKVQSPLWKAGI